MTDRKTITSWLEGLSMPDWRLFHSDSEVQNIAKEALDLLKEQTTTSTNESRIFHCKKCGYGIDDIFLSDEHNYQIEPCFCPNCGRIVKRND